MLSCAANSQHSYYDISPATGTIRRAVHDKCRSAPEDRRQECSDSSCISHAQFLILKSMQPKRNSNDAAHWQACRFFFIIFFIFFFYQSQGWGLCCVRVLSRCICLHAPLWSNSSETLSYSYCMSHINGAEGKMYRKRNKGKDPSLRSAALHSRGQKLSSSRTKNVFTFTLETARSWRQPSQQQQRN